MCKLQQMKLNYTYRYCTCIYIYIYIWKTQIFDFPEFLLEICLDIFPKMLWIMIAHPITYLYLLIYRNSSFCIKLRNSRLGMFFYLCYLWAPPPSCTLHVIHTVKNMLQWKIVANINSITVLYVYSKTNFIWMKIKNGVSLLLYHRHLFHSKNICPILFLTSR